MPAIHQFLAGFSKGDAISNEALTMRRTFRSWGFDSEIFSEPRSIHPDLRGMASDAAGYVPVAKPDDVVILHLSIGSTVNEIFSALPCRKAILYHNVTPAHHFELVNKKTACDLARGRAQIKALAGSAAVNLADSAYNARELEELGYRRVRVFPLMLDFDALRGSWDRGVTRQFDDGVVNVLFVGRCAPNKKIEDALTAFFCFSRCVEPNSRFIHVGSFAGTERYYYLLLAQMRDMGLNNVHFMGAIQQPQLNAFYRCAHMFLCMSEHEGFCIPIVESMFFNVPVLAFAAAAVPETMDGAGILFREKEFEAVAEMMGRLAHDAEFRGAVIRGQQARLTRYMRRTPDDELRQHLAPLLQGARDPTSTGTRGV